MNYLLRIDEAKSHETSNISFLSSLSDYRLEKKLAIIREQMIIAEKNKQGEAIELLKIWERQVIEARVLKHEQQPVQAEMTEIERELAEIEAQEEKVEKRTKILEGLTKQSEEATIDDEETTTEYQPPSDNQLKLF